MDDLIKLYWNLRSAAEKSGDEIAKIFDVGHHEGPASFFGIAFNNFTMTLELLNHYNNLWANLNPADLPSGEETRELNDQRVMHLQKMCFYELMCTFKFFAKK